METAATKELNKRINIASYIFKEFSEAVKISNNDIEVINTKLKDICKNYSDKYTSFIAVNIKKEDINANFNLKDFIKVQYHSIDKACVVIHDIIEWTRTI